MSLLRKTIGMLGLLLVGSLAPASAQFQTIGQPDAAYLSATTLLSVSDPDFSVLSGLTDGFQTVSFSADLVALTVPDAWATWGSPPATESGTPRVLWTQGVTELTLDFSNAVGIFGLEAQPNTGFPSPITVSFYNGAALLGEVALDVDGAGGAQLFAVSEANRFTRVTIASTDDFAIAQLRYGDAVPEPSVAALALCLGVSGLLFRRRRLRVRTER